MPIQITQHNANFSTAGQIEAADLPAIAAAGFTTVINNRPDGEGGPSQPLSADLAKAAQENGLAYVHIPVVSGQVTPAQVQQMAQALAKASGPVFCFCRSGTRSTNLYRMAQSVE